MTQARPGSEVNRARGEPPAVLVIDDSDVDREVMSELLSASGLTVHALPSPIGATRTARELGVRAVVIDQNLPAMDGGKLATLFRASPHLKGLRVVLVSGAEERAMEGILRASQADAFVSKQKLHDELVRTVKRLLAVPLR